MEKKYLTKNFKETERLGKQFASEILKNSQKFGENAFVIGLSGELGGGKTCFLQGFARGLGIKEKILSPTFVILKRFKITKLKAQSSKLKTTTQNLKPLKFQNFYHFDCYRVNHAKEILDLGFLEIISNPKNIVAIEWPENIREVLPKNTQWIKFGFIDENSRFIDFLD